MTDTTDLLEAAAAIVAEKGIGGLTLRPLAQRLGTSVSAITHRFGQKNEVLAAVCAAAAASETTMLAGWKRRFEGRHDLPAEAVAEIADAVLDDLSRAGRPSTLIHCELVLSAAWQPELRDALAPWLEQRAAFWAFVAGLAAAPPPFDLGGALHAYATDELGHGLALNGAPAYRWLRKLCLRRLCGGLLVDGRAWDTASFDRMRAELGTDLEQIDHGARYRAEKRSDMLAAVGWNIAQLILGGGSEAVTHRSVGQQAGMPATTLVYHFPRQADLLRAGLEAIIARLQGQLEENRLNERLADLTSATEIAVATFAVALAATRYPELEPFAADMRRRRGENGHVQLQRLSRAPERIDLTTAQVLSVVALGEILLRRANGASGSGPLYEALMSRCTHPPTEGADPTRSNNRI